MKRAGIWTFLVALALALALGSPALAADHKVDICHFPNGNPENTQVISVGPKAAEKHLDRHGDFLVLGFNINGVGCAFCADSSPDCQVFCVGPPLCLCPPDDPEACCEANPCCDNCPDPKPDECFVSTCGSDPPECSLTVCSAPDDD